jgi:hypothetical protein
MKHFLLSLSLSLYIYIYIYIYIHEYIYVYMYVYSYVVTFSGLSLLHEVLYVKSVLSWLSRPMYVCVRQMISIYRRR